MIKELLDLFAIRWLMRRGFLPTWVWRKGDWIRLRKVADHYDPERFQIFLEHWSGLKRVE